MVDGIWYTVYGKIRKNKEINLGIIKGVTVCGLAISAGVKCFMGKDMTPGR